MIRTPGWWAVQLAFANRERRWALLYEHRLLLEVRKRPSRLLEVLEARDRRSSLFEAAR